MLDLLPTLAGPWLVVACRSLGLAWAGPALGSLAVGWRLRLALVGVLTMVLGPSIGPTLDVPVGALALGRTCLGELAVGAALGLSAGLVIAAARQAGEVVGMQSGLSAAALFDPEVNGELTPVGHLYGLVALGVFLAMDGPMGLVRSLAESYRVAPAGGPELSAELADWAFGRVGEALSLSLRAAAPTALALVAAGLALGLLGRAAGGLGLLSLALPARSALGLLLVGLGLATLASTLAAGWDAALGPMVIGR